MKKLISKFNSFIQLLKSVGKNPALDWRLALFCFVGLIIISVLVHLYIYDSVLIRDQNSNEVTNTTSEFLNREDINLIIKKLEEKRLDTTNIRVKALNDPSI